ncbi:MAG: GTP-binding protein [Betaproteobacteria bacterium]|uniref:GTP-binding protein n=1 Tax=Candidatus Proximibacter danicus TaxID=2954365 RepID=A0A9D7PS73_9PROT|nr:GTP-binding protein [Candidatus Proximibacter danicus]
MADRLLLTKCDLATPEQIARVGQRIARINPGAPQIEVRRGAVDAAVLAGCGFYDPVSKTADVRHRLGEEVGSAAASEGRPGHDHGTRPASPRCPRAWFRPALLATICLERVCPKPPTLLLPTRGDRILRLKGLDDVVGDDLPRVIHCVQTSRCPEAALPAWPDDDRRSRLVFIVRISNANN